MCQNCRTCDSRISKIDFTENLSDRKILKFPHCVYFLFLSKSVQYCKACLNLGNIDKRMHACGELIKGQYFAFSGLSSYDGNNFTPTKEISIHEKGEDNQRIFKVFEDKLVER